MGAVPRGVGGIGVKHPTARTVEDGDLVGADVGSCGYAESVESLPAMSCTITESMSSEAV